MIRGAELVDEAHLADIGLLELFEGDAAAAQTWLNTPCRALGWRIPAELLATESGVRDVMNAITRLQHGVYS